MTIRIAIVGFGKIARDSHLPAIVADRRYTLAAVATRGGDPGVGVPWFPDIDAMIAALPGALDAVAICTPPGPRYAVAMRAIDAGLAVLLEKPPAATLGESVALRARAAAAGVPIHASWHARHAPGVEPARAALAAETVSALRITWHEDVDKWHPGQAWIWEAGSFGVFDPGINGLSIATRILPRPLLVRAAQFSTPAGKAAPIAARITFDTPEMFADFDWRVKGDDRWSIAVETASGRHIELHDGGHRLVIDKVERAVGTAGEYPGIYDHFAGLVAARTVDLDDEPLRVVADAFLLATQTIVDPVD